MGAINYMTSEYVTVGLKPFDFYDIKDEMLDFIANDTSGYWGGLDLTDDEVYSEMNERTEDYFNAVDSFVSEHNFENFDVNIDSGYYEGFSINIKNNMYFTEETDKDYARKEAKDLCEMLKELVNAYGLCVCIPGWSTAYLSKEDSIKEIDKALDKMNEDIDKEPIDYEITD